MLQLAMRPAASRSPPKRDGAATGAVLVPGSLALLPHVGFTEIPPEWRMDEPSWRCRMLWLAVLERALADARGCRGFGAARYKNLVASRARAWLRRPTADRTAILELCGIDPDAFESRGLPYLERTWAKLDVVAEHLAERRYLSAWDLAGIVGRAA